MPQTRKCRGVATTIWADTTSIRVQYHNTEVVTIRATGTVTLRTGGWRTAPTKLRMNQAANEFGLGFRVFQQDGAWFVSLPDDSAVRFAQASFEHFTHSNTEDEITFNLGAAASNAVAERSR